MIGFEENEISENANGGTELSKRKLADLIPDELLHEFQIIPSRVRDLREDKIRLYWQHDLAMDPEVSHLADPSSRDQFHKFCFVSHWQLNDFVDKLKFPQTEKCQVIENPIDPLEAHVKPKDVVNLVYFSTPQRGLDILVPVFEELAKKHDNIHLHVFSSFKIYGWEDSDKAFEPLFNRIKQHGQMTYHGVVPNDVLREKLKEMHILAYPSIWQETSCRVLMESMSAGLMCVHPNLAALPETSGGLTSMYQYFDDHNKHAHLFMQYLDHAIGQVHKESASNYLAFVKTYADTRYNAERIASQWEGMLLDLEARYPTKESRAFPKDEFVYKT